MIFSRDFSTSAIVSFRIQQVRIHPVSCASSSGQTGHYNESLSDIDWPAGPGLSCLHANSVEEDK